MRGDDPGKNVFSEVVGGFRIFGIGEKNGDEQLGVENVYAHGRVAVTWFVGRSFRVMRFFFEADDAPIFIGFDDAKLASGLGGRNLDGSDGDVGAGLYMLLEHFGVIHFVDVIAGENENVFGAFTANGINVLINRVGGALIPLLGDAHLRRKHFDEFTESHERRPACANVAAEAQGFVLGESENATQAGVDAIGKRDIDDAIERAEGDGGFGAIAGERPEAFALAPGEKNSNGIAHVWHERSAPGWMRQFSVPAEQE